MSPKVIPENILHLQENGPTRFSDLPNEFKLSDRRHGAARLHLKKQGASPGGQGGHTEPVAYLFESHDEQDVVREYLDANPNFVESLNHHALIQRFFEANRSFGEAAVEVINRGVE